MEKQKLPRELQQDLASLNRAIFVREAEEAAVLYGNILQEVPGFVLRGPAQYDLARLLETSNQDELALKAYEGILEQQKDNPVRNPSLKAAGTICWKLKKYEKCLEYLELFLKTKPMTPDRQEAEEILSRLPPATAENRKKRQEAEKPRVDEIPSSWNAEEGKPLTFEWKMPRKEKREEKFPPGIVVEQPKHETAESIRASRLPGLSSPPQEQSRPLRLSIPQQPVKRPPSPPPVPQSWHQQIPASYPLPQHYGMQFQAAPSQPVPPIPIISPPMFQPPPPEAKPAAPAMAAAPASPSFAPLPSPQSESPEARYDRLREGQFALILPLGKRIHLDTVAELLANYDDIPEAEAKKIVLRRKGVLYDGLSMTQVLDLCPLVKKCRQSLLFVAIPRDLQPYEYHEVNQAEMREQGLRMATGSSIKRIRWGDIRVINCGVVDGETRVTLVGSEPAKEYRFSSSSFNYHSFSPTGLSDFHTGITEFLELVSAHASKAVKSHTVENVLNRKMVSPQVFPSDEEYSYYKSWVLYSHFGETIKADELAELNQVSSNW